MKDNFDLFHLTRRNTKKLLRVEIRNGLNFKSKNKESGRKIKRTIKNEFSSIVLLEIRERDSPDVEDMEGLVVVGDEFT